MALSLKAHFNKAQKLYQKRQFELAIAELESCLKLNPQHVASYFLLGNISKELEMYDAAVKWYDITLSLSPEQTEAIFNKAHTYQLKGDNETALELYLSLESEMAGNALFYNNLGTLYTQMTYNAHAIVCFKKAIALRPGFHDAKLNLAYCYFAVRNARHYFSSINQPYDPSLWKRYFSSIERYYKNSATFFVNRAFCYFNNGDYAEGWQDYRWRLDSSFPKSVRYVNSFPRWTGESLNGKTILLSAEQGIGDQISFLSVLPEIIQEAEKVIVEVNPKLQKLLQQSFPDIEVRTPDDRYVYGRHQLHYEWVKTSIDFFAPLGEAFLIKRPSIESFPSDNVFLRSEQEELPQIQKIRQQANGRPLVGVSWRSHKLSGSRSASYMPLESLKELIYENKEYQFVSIQYCAEPEELHAFGKREDGSNYMLAAEDIDWFDDLLTSATFISQLDYVISVRNTQFCLAAALGLKTISYNRSFLQFGQLRTDPIYPNTLTVSSGDSDVFKQIQTILDDFETCLKDVH